MRPLRLPRTLLLLLTVLATLAGCGESPREKPVAPHAREAPSAQDLGPFAALAPGFVDVAAEAGVGFVHTHGGNRRKFLFETMGAGVAVADFDGDGLPELLFVQSGTLPADEFDEKERERAGHAAGEGSRLYRNEGGFRFSDATAGSGLERPFYGQGVAVGDVDADGDRDVYLAAYGRDRLHRNEGGLRFSDVTAEAGLHEERWTVGGAFLDVDLDGDLDLYSVAYLDMPISSHRFCGPSRLVRTYCHVDSWPGLDDRLWINDGNGRFTDGSEAASLTGTAGKGLAVIGGDWDDDGDPDLFVANDSQANLLLQNEGGGRFTDVSRRSGADLDAEGRSEACMGVDMGDLDGDLDLDLLVVNFQQETNTLYRNDGRGFFTDVSVRSGLGPPSHPFLGFGTVFLDVESDGDLDVYVANGHIDDNVADYEKGSTYAQHDLLFLGDGKGRFTRAPGALGTSLREPRVGRGVARGDLDGDGDADLAVNNSNDRPWLLRNDVPQGRRVALRLLGPGGRADAEGARVTLEAGGRTFVREVHAGGSYASHNDTELLVGLGEAGSIERLHVRWPGGGVTELSALQVDARHELSEAGGLLRSTPLR